MTAREEEIAHIVQVATKSAERVGYHPSVSQPRASGLLFLAWIAACTGEWQGAELTGSGLDLARVAYAKSMCVGRGQDPYAIVTRMPLAVCQVGAMTFTCLGYDYNQVPLWYAVYISLDPLPPPEPISLEPAMFDALPPLIGASLYYRGDDTSNVWPKPKET